LLRNAQKRDKKKIEQNNRGLKKKTEEKKAAFFVKSPDGLFRGKVFFVFLNSPCHETPKKRLKKNRLKKKEKKK
jgi:hypothetical protein